MIRTQDQAQNEKRLTFKSKRLQPKSAWLTAALFDITPRDRLSVGRSAARSQINKSAHAIMWLYTSCKPHKNRKRVSLVQSTVMSRVVKNNRGFLQLLAHFPIHQCEFLLRTATPQQVHALVQVLYNVRKQHIPFPEENRQKLLPYKDVLISLAEPNVPYKKKKYILVQEGGGFIQDLLPPVISSLGFLLL